MKRQWEAVIMPLASPSYAATYGPVLDRKRQEFSETASTAWGIVGMWLKSMVQKEPEWILTIKALLEAGIFFDTDVMEESIIPALRTRRWIPSFPGEPMSLYWLCHVRPHLQTLQLLLLTLCPMIYDDDVSQDDVRNQYRGMAMVYLVSYMTKEEQETYARYLGLSMKVLDYSVDNTTMRHRNVALEVFNRISWTPPEQTELVWEYLIRCDPDGNNTRFPATSRQRLAFDALLHLSSKELAGRWHDSYTEEVTSLIQRTPENLTDGTESYTFRSVFRVLVKAQQTYDIAFYGLDHVKSELGYLCAVLDHGNGRERVPWIYRDDFRQWCIMCIGEDEATKLLNQTTIFI